MDASSEPINTFGEEEEQRLHDLYARASVAGRVPRSIIEPAIDALDPTIGADSAWKSGEHPTLSNLKVSPCMNVEHPMRVSKNTPQYQRCVGVTCGGAAAAAVLACNTAFGSCQAACWAALIMPTP